jgi:tetraprenyl-beta-curcumene synthase
MFRRVVPRARKAVRVGARSDEGESLIETGIRAGGACLPASVGAFAGAARRYWLGVFPSVRREAAHWRRRAGEIADPALRAAAVANLQRERMNLDGAAAFAAFVPDAHRGSVVRAQVALQAAYDYVDTLAEHPCADPVRNGERLHRVLGDALDPEGGHIDYYAYHPHRDDGGYLRSIVESCRAALRQLPSYGSVAASVCRAVTRMVSYQSLNLNEAQGDHMALAHWAHAQTPECTDLRWWETAASAGSSLGVYTLIAAAASHEVSPAEATAIEEAYFPWVGSLHLLLDSLVDQQEDRATGQPSLLAYYSSREEAAARLGLIATESVQRIRTLPGGDCHALLLAGMAGHYLTMPAAHRAEAISASRAVLAAIGGLAAPTMAVMGARQLLERAQIA